MSAICSLRQLIATLHPNEISTCRNYLKAFDSRGEKFDSKSLKLFNLVVSSNSVKDQDLEYLLYGRSSGYAYSRLLLRLRDKLLEVIVLPVNSSRNAIPGERGQQCMHVRWRTLQAQLLIDRGADELAEILLLSIDETTSSYELFPERLAVLDMLEQMALGRNQKKRAAQWSKQSTFCRQQLGLIEMLRQYITVLETPGTEHLFDRIERLREYASESPSVHANYLLLEAEARIKKEAGYFKHEAQFRKRQLNFIRNNPVLLNSKHEVASLIALARCHLNLHQPQKALELCGPVSRLLRNNDPYHQELIELHIVALILSGNLSEALGKITDELKMIRNEKLVYLNAVILFLAHDFDGAAAVMNDLHWKKLDESGWGVWARLLTRMVLIERSLIKGDNNMKAKLMRLDRRLQIAENLTPREQLARDLMQSLLLQNVDFRATYKIRSEQIKLLRLTKGETTWRSESGEIITFVEWFMTKVLGVL